MGFAIPYIAISPTAILSIVGLLIGRDETIPTPAQDWRKATVDIIIPTLNEQKNIVLCLASLRNQTFKPRSITIYDDGSNDETILYARNYGQNLEVDFKIVQREKSEGKTVSLKHVARHSDCDVIFVLDGDTSIITDNFIEKIVQELYQGIGNASACGHVLPMLESEREKIIDKLGRDDIAKNFPAVLRKKGSWLDKLQYGITNFYREELYLFLERFIYNGEMIFFGSIINPIGCAVAYRREYLEALFDEYEEEFGDNLTTSEDIFIGFALVNSGYKNVLVDNIYALTQEPKFSKIFKQIFKWSSSYLQCCYYFDDLVSTPFKFYRVLYRKFKDKVTGLEKKIKQMRKIKEAYRQPFGMGYTKTYGRPIGWFVFTSAFEKCSFPFALLAMAYLGLWKWLIITIIIEVFLYTFMIFKFHRNRRFANFVKSILLTPIRYSIMMFDVYVLSSFLKDIYFTEERAWRK